MEIQKSPVSEGAKPMWGDTPELPPSIQDHALIGDRHTAALVAKDGAIDFLCLPDFDSGASFASLLGNPENGRWKISPTVPIRSVKRKYRGRTLILETELTTDEGSVRLVDFMPLRAGAPHLVRIVEGVRGKVPLEFDLRPRFANGRTIPRVSPRDGATAAIAGPDALYLRGGPQGGATPFHDAFTIAAGQRIPFVLSWARPYDDMPKAIDPDAALAETEASWERWAAKIKPPSEYTDTVIRSLLTLRACTFHPSGAIVAAPTFGLPETPRGERNWDYRFCWIRDSALTLNAFMSAGLEDEARAFGQWLVDAIGGAPSQLQIMYGIRGESMLTEVELPWLEGYGGAKPVRVGNGAYDQFQLDVFGEFAAVLYRFASLVGKPGDRLRAAMKAVATATERAWTKQDHGIWEMRGPVRSFTASKVSAWVVFDRWVRAIDAFGFDEDPAPWIALRQKVFDEVCEHGYDPKRNTFTQSFGSTEVDGSLLFIPMSGFLPPNDPRVVGTVKAIEEDLMPDGLVLRYRTQASDDGLAGEEGVFLACSFWLVNTYQMMGRHEDARRLFEKLVGLCNDVGLLAEEYLVKERQQTGNFPQAFSHLTLVNSAYVLTGESRSPDGVQAPN